MEVFLQHLISGVAAGGTYALVALGFALIFGVSNVLNIAHGETIMLAPAVAVILNEQTDWPGIVLIILGLGVTLIAATLMHLVGVQPFVGRKREVHHLAPLIATFGIVLIVSNLMAKEIGTIGRRFPIDLPRNVWRVPGGILVDPMDVATVAIVLVLVASLTTLIAKSDFGRAMRAVAEDPTVAATHGISVTRTILITTILAGGLGATAGFLFAASTNTVTPFMGLTYGLTGLVALIIGGVTRLSGAVAAGLLIGVIQSMTGAYISSKYVTVVTFGLLIVILLIRPTGLVAMVSREGRP